MIKFIHKKHSHKDHHTKAVVIYYSLSDILLGFVLVVLVALFIYNYLKFSFERSGQISNAPTEIKNDLQNPNMLNKPIKKAN